MPEPTALGISASSSRLVSKYECLAVTNTSDVCQLALDAMREHCMRAGREAEDRAENADFVDIGDLVPDGALEGGVGETAAAKCIASVAKALSVAGQCAGVADGRKGTAQWEEARPWVPPETPIGKDNGDGSHTLTWPPETPSSDDDDDPPAVETPSSDDPPAVAAQRYTGLVYPSADALSSLLGVLSASNVPIVLEDIDDDTEKSGICWRDIPIFGHG